MNRSRRGLRALALVAVLVLPSQHAAVARGAQPAAADSSTRKFVRALSRHVPVMRFDSGEDFFPVSVRAITNNVGNRLLRGNDALIAERRSGGRGLTIRYLRGTNRVYPNGDAILASDKLDERGGDPDQAAREDARRFQNSPRYGDRIYGRIVYLRDGDEIKGAWLQYWFFYYYNDFPRVDVGDHEGDWEMIQVRVNSDARPTSAVYAQHRGASRCGWSDVRKRGSRPIVYVALGSHASYFRPGPQGQDRDNDGEQGRRVRGLIRIGTRSPQWLNWPGHWGNSGSSPGGPRSQGAKFTDADRFGNEAEPEEDCQ